MSNVETEKIQRVVDAHTEPMTRMLRKHEEMHETAQDLQAQSYEQMARLQEASNMVTNLVIGEVPPNPDKLGLHLDMHAVKGDIAEIKNAALDKKEKWSNMKWALILGAVGAVGTGIVSIIWMSVGVSI